MQRLVAGVLLFVSIQALSSLCHRCAIEHRAAPSALQWHGPPKRLGLGPTKWAWPVKAIVGHGLLWAL
jgi:hypothetical protein